MTRKGEGFTPAVFPLQITERSLSAEKLLLVPAFLYPAILAEPELDVKR